MRRRLVVWCAMLAIFLTVVSCSRGEGGASRSSPAAETRSNEIAAMFLRNKDRLKPPSPAIETSLSLDVAGFVVPLAGSGSNEVTIEFSVKNQEGGAGLVVASLIPYAFGDVDNGPGARFTPLENLAFHLGSGEKKQVSVKVARERVMPSSPTQKGEQPGGQPRMLSPGKLEGADKPAFRLEQQASPAPLFDPSMGLKVLVVVADEASVGPAVLSQMRAVADDDFEKQYGNFQRREFAIPVPPEQIL